MANPDRNSISRSRKIQEECSQTVEVLWKTFPKTDWGDSHSLLELSDAWEGFQRGGFPIWGGGGVLGGAVSGEILHVYALFWCLKGRS